MRPAHRIARITVLATLVLSACGVERSGLQVPDLGPGIDGGRLDLGTVDLGNVDLGVSDPDLGVSDPDLGPEMLDLGPEIVDLGPPDLGPPDLGPPDMGPPDMGPPDLGPPDLGRPSCASIYGGATDTACAERATECEFYSTYGSGPTSCVDRCEAFGGTCIAAYDNGASACTRVPSSDPAADCRTAYSGAICVCSR